MRQLILKDAMENDFSDLLKTIRASFGTDSDSNYLLWNDLTEQELANLSAEYFYRSYRKRLTTMSRVAFDLDPTAFLTTMSLEISLRFGDNFKRVFDTYFKGEYKPLNNYDMTEERTPDLSFETNADQDFKTTTTSEGKEYGFNSTEGVPVSEATSTSEGDKTENKNHSKTTHTGKETLTRAGNIGVMSSQDLARQELDLRRFDYWEFVFESIDKVLVRNYFIY